MSTAEKERYRPYDDVRLYPGVHLSDERRRRLDEDAVGPDELTTEDIVYKLSRMVTGTMYTMLELIEERWGKDVAREMVTEWGRRRGSENLKRYLDQQGIDRMTPELWARFQDYRHLISGPVHVQSFLSYEGDSEIVLNRSGCLFHDGRPQGMDSYCAPMAEGIFVGYAEACPGLESRHSICKSRGDSESHCQVRFTIRS